MAHFYEGVSGGRGEANRCGTKNGLQTFAKGWSGKIEVSLVHQEGKDIFRVWQVLLDPYKKTRLLWEGNLDEFGPNLAEHPDPRIATIRASRRSKQSSPRSPRSDVT